MKQKIFNIIQIGDKSNRISRFFDIFITVTIFCNIAVIFRMLRVARIFHLFRLNAKYDSFNIITTVLYEKRNQIISSVFIVFILMLASSLCMYSVEHEAQPTVFRNAFSGIWWSMSTLLTVGYGDIYPVTTLGRIMAICIAYLGVGAVAIPTGIISAGFVEQYQRKSGILDYRHADIREIAELFVDKQYAGKTVEELEETEQFNVYLLLRDGLSVLPQKDLILKQSDIIIIRGHEQ
jgi:voltage-gated potassium channel